MDFIEIYQLEEVVGRGGMSTVYRAYDTVQGYEVAVKLMHESLSGDEKARARFSQEVRFVTALHHPAIVPVLDYGEVACDTDCGEPGGRFYIVMPYLSGGTLRERLKDGPLEFDETLAILERIVPALEAVHGRNIVHRDIKPHNILLDGVGQAYLSDFGVARLVDPERSGETITLVGTPEYIAPEQILGKAISFQTDVYQLGVTVFHLLTGERPFIGSSIPQQHLDSPVPSAEAMNLNLPEGCDRVIWRAMAKDMAARYSSPEAFLIGLRRVKEPLTVTAFTPWSLDSTEVGETAEKNESLRRYLGLPRRMVSLAALALVILSGLFFSLNGDVDFAAAAGPVVAPVVETINEILLVSDGGTADETVVPINADEENGQNNGNRPPPPPGGNGRDGRNGPERRGGDN
jgi:serine/threonine protein kinase